MKTNQNLSRLEGKNKVINESHPELLNKVILNLFQNLSFRNDEMLKQVQHDESGAFGMLNSARGFTFIELLVVVLIIGILAAIALPQYKHAVTKARMTQAISAAKNIAVAEQRYYMENNVYTTNLSELDIQYPLSDDKKKARFSDTSCYVESITSLEDVRVKCDVLSPRMILQEYIGIKRSSCISYSYDNYAGDVFCQQIAGSKHWYNGCSTPACHIYAWK